MPERCEDLVAFNTKGQAEQHFYAHMLPSLRPKYKVVVCKKCDKTHIRRKKNDQDLLG